MEAPSAAESDFFFPQEIALSNTKRMSMNSLVIMGVAGCGKSSLGTAVADALGWTLIEGDDFHADASKAKMRQGIALTTPSPA